jgi:hypothetical protein
MKNKKFLIFVIIFVLIIKIFILASLTFAQNFENWSTGPNLNTQVIPNAPNSNMLDSLSRLWDTIKSWDPIGRIILGVAKIFLIILANIADIFATIIHKFLSEVLILRIAAPWVDQLSNLNPFLSQNNDSPIAIIFNILKNFAYIFMVFSALMAGYEWLIGKDDNAKRLIFNIILVALIINFMYVLIKEAFLIVYNLEGGIAGFKDSSTGKQVKIPGTFITASFYNKGNPEPLEAFKKISNNLRVEAGAIVSLQFNRNSRFEEEEPIKGFMTETLFDIIPLLVNILAVISTVVFDIILLAILVLLGVIYLARYIAIIFLAGVSPIVLTSLIFPKFQGAVAKAFSSFSEAFDNWFQELIKWLVVGPILLILVILGNVLLMNISSNLQVSSDLTRAEATNQAVELFAIFGVLIGWYLISMRIAINMSGKIGEKSVEFTYSGFRSAGSFVATRFLRSTGIGTRISNIGEGLLKKYGGEEGTIKGGLASLGSKLISTGERLQRGTEERQKQIEKLLGQKARLISQDFLYEKDDAKKQQIISSVIDSLNKNLNNPRLFKSFLDGLDVKIIEEIQKNPNFVKEIESSKLLKPEDKDEIFSHLISKLNKDTIEEIFKNDNLLTYYDSLIKSGPLSNKAFLEKIKTLDEQEAMSILDQVKNQINNPGSAFREMIDAKANEQIKKSLNKTVNGLIDALLTGTEKEIGLAISNLDSRTWNKFHKTISTLILNTQKDLGNVLKEAFQRNPDNILRGLLSLPDPQQSRITQELQNLKGTKSPDDFLMELGINPQNPESEDKRRMRQLAQLGIIKMP